MATSPLPSPALLQGVLLQEEGVVDRITNIKICTGDNIEAIEITFTGSDLTETKGRCCSRYDLALQPLKQQLHHIRERPRWGRGGGDRGFAWDIGATDRITNIKIHAGDNIGAIEITFIGSDLTETK
ncbi:hypothetical protein OPV22_013901 [Ensete ventricosum]|uniref:Uncharacterized protein n=1 Tax=Ensete ventricosum TaxID=4639 RepID=A0AAV8R0F1_ENSVE|nr:hypothetical protein OPV22_013901 [Ensete ventricosum]